MKRLLMNATMGASLVAAFLFIQGCTTTSGTDGSTPPAIEEQPPVEVQDISDVQPPKPVTTAKQGARPAAPAKVDVQSIDIQSLTGTTAYTVKSGDTISAIAYRHGLRWQDVLAVNPGLQPNKLRVGQTIQLPGVVDVSSAKSVPSTVKSAPAQPKANATSAKTTAPKTTAAKQPAAVAYTGATTTYVVKKGDALSTIAQKHGVKLAALRAANPKLKGDKIMVGQKIQIPTTAGKAAPAATTQGAKKEVKQVAITKSANTTPPTTKKAEAKKTAATTTTTTAPTATVTTPAVQTTTEQPKEPANTVTPPTPQPAPQTEAKKETVPTPSNVQTYKVKEGEDVYAVAIRWGVSPSDLKALNGLTGNELTPGMELKLPAPQ